MEDPKSCGDGMADVLAQHAQTLVLEDGGARSEQAAYQQVIALQRRLSSLARALADDMRQFSTLPAAQHDFDRVGQPAFAAAFGHLVRRKEELLELLQDQLADDRTMLQAGAGD
jgi:hypothetical protein